MENFKNNNNGGNGFVNNNLKPQEIKTVEPVKPSFLENNKNTLIGAALGLLLGGGVAYFMMKNKKKNAGKKEEEKK